MYVPLRILPTHIDDGYTGIDLCIGRQSAIGYSPLVEVTKKKNL